MATYLTVLGALLVAGVLLSRASARFGVPTLLAVLTLGMLAREGGIGGIAFNNYHLSFAILQSITSATSTVAEDARLDLPEGEPRRCDARDQGFRRLCENLARRFAPTHPGRGARG